VRWVLYLLRLMMECIGLVSAMFVMGFLLFALCSYAELALDFMREVSR